MKNNKNQETPTGGKGAFLFISHDANRAGGQIMLLDFVKYFAEKGHKNTVLLLDGGVLESEFAKYAKVLKYPKAPIRHFSIRERIKSKFSWGNRDERKEFFEQLDKEKFDLIYANTVATAWVLPELTFLNLPIITHIHELEFSLQLYANQENRRYQFENSKIIIACSDAVGENLIKKHQVKSDKIKTIHSFVDNEIVLSRIQKTDNQAIKQKYNLPNNKFLISSCGNAEWRKGLDIFLLMVAQCQNTDIHFVWVGIPKSGELYEKALFDIERLGIENKLTLIEQTPEAIEIIASTDVFAMTSREDPFPLVMLEAALAEKPIVGFAQSGGITEFVEKDAGFVIPYLDTTVFVNKIEELAQNPEKAKDLGSNAKQKVLKKYNFANSMEMIEDTISKMLLSVNS